jgi:hypothetical protein
MVQHRNLFQGSNFPKSYLPLVRGSSWHKNEIKMIIRGHYSTNNFQESTKRKSTEKKTLSYLPRVLFFNTFELGAKSGNQVFSNEGALRSFFSLKTPLVTIGTLDALADDATCKSLIVELKVLPILKTFCGFWYRHLGNIHKFLLFSNKSFLLLNLREEKIELKVSIDSSNLPILRF